MIGVTRDHRRMRRRIPRLIVPPFPGAKVRGRHLPTLAPPTAGHRSADPFRTSEGQGSHPAGHPPMIPCLSGSWARGRLKAKLRLALEEYRGEDVTLRLEDATGQRAEERLPALLPLGGAGKAWRYEASGAGVKRMTLRRMGKEGSGRYKLQVRARKWFMGTGGESAAHGHVRRTLLRGYRALIGRGPGGRPPSAARRSRVRATGSPRRCRWRWARRCQR